MPMPSYLNFIDGANLQQPTYQATGSTGTASYSAPNPPPARSTPSHIVFDSELHLKMRGSLNAYLTAKLGGQPVSDQLAERLRLTQVDLADCPPSINDEARAREFFTANVAPLVRGLVRVADNQQVRLENATASYGAELDPIWGGRVHVEIRSPGALLHYAPEISEMGKANDGNGSALVLRQHEEDGRYIIFKIGISMATRELTWGILTSGVVSIFFHRRESHDTNGEPHHVLTCSDLIYSDAKHPSLFSLCAATLLGVPEVLAVRPVNTRVALQPYPLSLATRSKTGRRGAGGSRNRRTPAAHISLRGVRRKATIFKSRAGVRGQCLSKCPTLRVQFLASYWPDAVYSVHRVRPESSHASGTTRRLPPPHLRLHEKLRQGEFGQVLNGVVSVSESGIKRNVIAKLYLSAHLDRFHNESRLYRTRLAKLQSNIVPKVFGAFVARDSTTSVASETTEKWGIIVMENCGCAVQSIDELTVNERVTAFQSLTLIHQAGVEPGNFDVNHLLISSNGIRVIDFSEAVEHSCPGPECYGLLEARRLLELPYN